MFGAQDTTAGERLAPVSPVMSHFTTLKQYWGRGYFPIFAAPPA